MSKEYSVDYISGIMSLRKPQKRSLEILHDILESYDDIEVKSQANYEAMISDKYQIFRSFEFNHPSITFALSMGVGKTRLMGAFITYLFANRNIKNFFIVAPSLTIYEKLQSDLGVPTSEKYVFKGVGVFNFLPNIITGENYDSKTAISLNFGDINIFIFNNAKFNREATNIRQFSEILGQSYFEYLSSIDDLVVILDESHHYRNNETGSSISELKPCLAIELTGTPYITVNGANQYFRNVVYDYPMARAINDGYTKTPYAMTRRDMILSNFSPEQLDVIMLKDGVDHHENVKEHLKTYAINSGERIVKPFILVVCRNTEHANLIADLIRSDEFYNARYRDKVLSIHSNQDSQEKDENIKLLLDLESMQNNIEIVVHVDILKEGWDVNNLYTIVPLRTANSRVLRMQTIGRGLRLPFGKRTGDKLVDSLTITAHDKFDEIVQEAQDPNSIFKLNNVIFKEDQVVEKSFQTITIYDLLDNKSGEALLNNYDVNDIVQLKSINSIQQYIASEVFESIKKDREIVKNVIYPKVISKLSDNKDLFEKIKEEEQIFEKWFVDEIEKNINRFSNSELCIPQIRVTSDSEATAYFKDFDFDYSRISFEVVNDEILVKNLLDLSDVEIVKTKGIDFLIGNPSNFLIKELVSIPEIDYEENCKLIVKIVGQLIEYIKQTYGENQLNHIVIYNKNRILNELKNQFLLHHVAFQPTLIEEIIGIDTRILSPRYNVEEINAIDIYRDGQLDRNKRSLFTGFKKSLHLHYRFDSMPEITFALICDSDPIVVKWFKPALLQFNLFYATGKRYQPDFVVETIDSIYLVEIKGEDRLEDRDVILKKERAISYCKLASAYSAVNNLKPWIHLFIPAASFNISTSFEMMVNNSRQ